MRITAAHIKDFKRIHDIEIRPDADRTLILIGGKNAQGKSSILDALTAAFGGKRSQPTDPIRHGAESAEIFVELDGGELSIKRVIVAGGESVIEVRDRFGAVKSPQAILDKLVGARFLDPLAFLQLPAKEQRATLMKLIDGADRISGLNEKRQRAFDKRTEIGRDLTKAEGELARLPEAKIESPIDVAALTAEERTFTDVARAADTARSRHREAQAATAAAKSAFSEAKSRAADIEAQIQALTKRLAEVRGDANSLGLEVGKNADAERATETAVREAEARWDELKPRRIQVDADLARANEHNRAVFAAEASAKRRTEAEAEVAKLSKERDDLTAVLGTIDARKAEILGAAKLPVDGLSVADDGIELHGVPFAQASGAERLRVALALAMAAAPELGDVWIRDGALLDEESLELVAANAAAAGKRVWIERVGTKDPGVIVIADGKVAAS